MLMQFSQRCPLTVPVSSVGGLRDAAAVCRFPVTVTLLEMRITAVFATRHTHSHGLRLVQCQVSVEADTDSAPRALARDCTPSLLCVFSELGTFTGCFWAVFFSSQGFK